jgi:hypothetical protein
MNRLLLPLVIAGIFLYSCQEEYPIVQSNQVQFTFDAAEGAELPENISVELRFQEASGAAITKNISFTRSGNSYTSRPVSLEPGTYTLNNFLIVDQSLSANLTLDKHFAISGEGTRAVSMGRLQLKENGKNNLLFAVYTHDGPKKKLTDAKLTFYNEMGETYEYMLSARTNRIEFKGNPEGDYYIIIEKEGYVQYYSVFSYSWLESKRFEVTLQELNQPGTITFQPSSTCFMMQLEVMGQGSVTLDWGQGEIEVIKFDIDPEDSTGTAIIYRENCYAISLPPAQISGDVHLIKGITFESTADALDVEYASGLQKLVLTDPYMPLLDLTNNTELRTLSIVGGYMGPITLPQQHAIQSLTISPGYNWPSTEQVDYLISNIYTNAVTRNITGGSIALNGAPVSQQTAMKLSELVNSYGWTVQY